MPFTEDMHQRLVYVNLLFLPAFITLIYISPGWVNTACTIVTTDILTYDDLGYEEKLKLMQQHNASSSAHAPLVLHLHQHTLSLHVLLIFQGNRSLAATLTLTLTLPTVRILTLHSRAGILLSCYSLMSSVWARQMGAAYTPMTIDDPTAARDAASITLDLLFWMLFIVTHAYVFLTLIRITTLEAALLFTLLIFTLIWALCNRLLHRYPPALFLASILVVIMHMTALYTITQRDPDSWLAYFMLALADTLLLIGHTVDETLNFTVLLNCRIATASAYGLLSLCMPLLPQ